MQLRQEDAAATAYNMVGFQTRMTWPEQKRVFAMIPGLEQVEFLRMGSVHRNTFVDAPRVLDADMQLRARPGVYLCGQVSGVEGYVESAAMGLILGIQLGRHIQGATFVDPPPTTALGALRGHLRRPNDRFQPSNVVWSMFPPLEGVRLAKRARFEAMAERALQDFEGWRPHLLDAAPTSHASHEATA